MDFAGATEAMGNNQYVKRQDWVVVLWPDYGGALVTSEPGDTQGEPWQPLLQDIKANDWEVVSG